MVRFSASLHVAPPSSDRNSRISSRFLPSSSWYGANATTSRRPPGNRAMHGL